MKFTVTFLAIIAASLAVKVHEDPKDKRDASEGFQGQYPSTSYQGPASNYQASAPHFPAQSFGHDASAVSIGAGYSVGAKPSFDFGSSSGYQIAPESLPASGHASIQLAPLTVQPSQSIGSSDLNDLMNQISQGLNSGAISLSQFQGHDQGGQDFGQLSFGSHNLQQLTEQSSIPSYAAGTKGLGSYGSTGPVLFNPAETHNAAQSTLSFAAPISGHSAGDANTLSLSDAGQSFAGLSLGSAHGLGGHGLQFISGGQGLTLGNSVGSVHPFGGSVSFAGSGHSFGAPLKSGGSYSGKPSFKPSAYLGSLHGDSHGLSVLSGSYAPSFGSHSPSGGHSFSGAGGHVIAGQSLSGGQGLSGGHSLSVGHGITGGHSLSGGQGLGGGHGGHSFSGGHGFSGGQGLSGGRAHGPSFGSGHGHSSGQASFHSFGGAPKLSHFSQKPEGYMTFEEVSAHLSSPNFGHGPSLSASHAASSYSPQFHASPAKYNKFNEGGSFKGLSGHGYSPKYHRSASSSRHMPKDHHGAYSETVYNTIKYSEELKPRVH